MTALFRSRGCGNPGDDEGADLAVGALRNSIGPALAGDRLQAGTAAWAEKIDSWAESGSITPMIFWTERT